MINMSVKVILNSKGLRMKPVFTVRLEQSKASITIMAGAMHFSIIV